MDTECKLELLSKRIVVKFNDNRLAYYLNTIFLVLLIMMPLGIFWRLGRTEKIALLFALVAIKIVIDVIYKLDNRLDKIPKIASCLGIILILFLTPVGGIYKYFNYTLYDFHLSPEAALGLEIEIDHIELIEGNIYAAYWDNGLQYGAAILENTFSGLRWETKAIYGYGYQLLGEPYWDAIAIATKEDDSSSFYYAAYFRTFEPEIRSDGFIVRYSTLGLMGFEEQKIQVNDKIKPGINFFSGIGTLDEESHPVSSISRFWETGVFIDGVEALPGSFGFRPMGGYYLYEDGN